jgi:subtilisin-like proprotein convertase family protein
MKQLFLTIFVFSSLAGFSQTYSGTTGLVSDDGTINDFTAVVSGLSPSTIDTNFGLISVCLTMTHTWDSDMDVTLISPDGSMFKLFSGVGGDQDDFTNTCLTHTATSSIVTGSAPFTGNFKPMEQMGNVNNGQNGNGTWILRLLDTYAFADQGNLLSWSITFGPNAEGPFVFVSSDIPIVLIDTYSGTIMDEPKINADIKILDNGTGVRNYLTDAPAFDGEMGIEIRGAFSSVLPQKPYTFELNNGSGVEVDTGLLGMPKEHDWHFIANYNDKAFVRNTLANHLFSKMGNYAIRSKFCEVLVNGQYQGIYLLSETIKRDNNRVDIAKLDSTENSGINMTGGYIIKNDYWDASNSWLSNYSPIDHPTYNVHLVYHYPKPDNITPAQKTYLQGYIDQYETALYSAGFSDTATGYQQYADAFSFVDYLIVNELARNNDGFKKSFYFNKDKDKTTGISKLKAGPVWDFDWAWKNIPSGGCIFDATDGSGWAHHINDCGPDVNSNGWHVRMMQDTIFQNILRCRWERFRLTILDTGYLFNYIDSVSNYLNEAQARHYEKWGHLGLNSGAPEVGPIPTTFQGEVDGLKEWIRLRVEWLDANIPGNAINCDFVSVAEANTSDFSLNIFPNPANEFIFVELSGINELTNIILSDISGKIVVQSRIDPSMVQVISTNSLANGMYTLTIANQSTGKLISKKLVVQKQ